MHFSKLILAAFGISFTVASPVPQNNNDTLESCNANCADNYDMCKDGAVNTVTYEGWYVTQWIFKLVVPLLTTEF